MDPELSSTINRREAGLAAVRKILIDNLGCQAEPQEIDADAPLFGTGLALDSVDALELVVAVEAAFGVSPPETVLRERLRTMNTLVDLLLQQQDERSQP